MLKKLLHKLFGIESDQENRLRRGLTVGENTVIYSWEGIDGNWPWLISIGSNTIISSNVTILAHDASAVKLGCHTKLAKVSIGDNCFIGTRTVVLCGVNIADNVIVGAGSVVSKDLESGFVYGGVPARKICSIEDYQKKMQALNESRPNFSEMHQWNEWPNAPKEDQEKMKALLDDGCGFI